MTEPALIAFERIFTGLLAEEIGAGKPLAGNALDDSIRELGTRNHDALKRVLRSAAIKLFNGGPVPRNRQGDAVKLYGKFVLMQLRAPTERHRFNDVMFRIATTDEIVDPLRVFVSDKEFSKLYVKAVLGEDRSVPTLAVLHDPAEVDGYDFPISCVVKPTHSCRQIVVVKPGEPPDKEKIKSWFRHDYYAQSREANYKTLRRKVIVEPLVFEGRDFIDLNIFCFEGEPKLLRISTSVFVDMHQSCLTLDWKQLGIKRREYPVHESLPPPPPCLDEMKDAAALLSARFGLIRIDFLVDGNDFHVGEITNLSGGGVSNYDGAGEREMSVQIFGQRAFEA